MSQLNENTSPGHVAGGPERSLHSAGALSARTHSMQEVLRPAFKSTASSKPRKNISASSRFSVGTHSLATSTGELVDDSMISMSDCAMSETTDSMIDTGDIPTGGSSATMDIKEGRRPPNRHASMPTLQQPASHALVVGSLPESTQSSLLGADQGAAATAATAGVTAGLTSPPRYSSAPLSEYHSGFKSPSSSGEPAAHGPRRPPRQNPSRLSLAAGPRPLATDSPDDSKATSSDGRGSVMASSSSRALPSGMVSLQKSVEALMAKDGDLFRQVQASMRGISSLAKETTKLEVGRDATGATCINQYVVVKTLGRGSFGKVKLCLNTLDGRLYAVKMVNRTFILKQLQKPAARGLRRRVPGRNASDSKVGGDPTASGGSVAAVQHSARSARAAAPMSCDNVRAFGAGSTHAAPVRNNSALDVSGPSFSSGSRPAEETGPGNPLDSVMREIAVLKKLDHPNVVKLHEVIDPPGASYMMLVMEYMEKGPVMETKGQSGFASFPERVALDYFRQTCAGLDYLHYNNVVHGDLKPENLLVTASGQLKIGDFGSSRVMGDASSSSKVSSTPAFCPPEAFSTSGEPEDPVAADVWALGVVLYCFVYGKLPFMGTCVLDMSRAIRDEEIKYPSGVRVSAELRDLFSRILCKDPSQRIGLQGVMEHPWVTEGGRSPLPSLRTLAAPPKMVEVSRNEAQAAIDRSSLVSMIRARLKERTFNPGEYLFKENDEAHCVYMIMSGVVEIVTHLKAAGDGSGSLGQNLDDMDDMSFSVDLDESFTLDCNQFGVNQLNQLNIVDGKLHIDRVKALELKKRMKSMLGSKQAEYVTEVKGPGQVIGEVSVDSKAVARHKASARARDTVIVVKLTEESFVKALAQMYSEGGGTAASGSGHQAMEDGAAATAPALVMGGMGEDLADSATFALSHMGGISPYGHPPPMSLSTIQDVEPVSTL